MSAQSNQNVSFIPCGELSTPFRLTAYIDIVKISLRGQEKPDILFYKGDCLMKNKKRILSVLLALCLLIPFGTLALAVDETPSYSWQPIPTSAEGLKAGDIYLTFDDNWCQGIVTPGKGYAGLHTAECMSAGTWFVDVEQGIVKGTFTALAAYSSSGEDETVVFDPSETELGCAYIFYFAISETGVEWQPVAMSTDGLKNGDFYIDGDALANGYVDFVADMLNTDSNPDNDITDEKALQMRQELKVNDVLTELYVNPHGTLYKYKVVMGEDTVYCPRENNAHNGNNLLAAMLSDVLPGCVKQYHEDPEISWITLPYSSDGLSEGDWYLDTKAFIDIIGKGKSDEEKDEALALIRQHVVFFFNPDGGEYVFKYVYTNLPLSDGTTVSGSVILPYDLTEQTEDAFPYDYTALQQSVKRYTSPVEPEKPTEPEEEQPNVMQTIIGRLKSIIQTILSFFRKIFKGIK